MTTEKSSPESTAPEAPLVPHAVESREKEETKLTFMFPGDAETPSISVRAASREKADELYEAELTKIKKETK